MNLILFVARFRVLREMMISVDFRSKTFPQSFCFSTEEQTGAPAKERIGEVLVTPPKGGVKAA